MKKDIKDLKESLNEIVETISYSGLMGFPLDDMEKYQDAISKLVAHKVIVVGAAKPSHKQEDELVILKGGENFLQANLKGGYNYIREVENDMNPPKLLKTWNYISTNPLISSFIAGILGGVIGGALLTYITQ